MTEEQVTKAILAYLLNCGWNIITYDFPQSGSGKLLHANGKFSDKNKGIIIDIVAVKDGVCLFFENKDRVVVSDYLKVSALIKDNQYTKAISMLLDGHAVNSTYYGIGFPSDKWNAIAVAHASLVDFIVGVTANKNIEFLYNPNKLAL